MWDSKELGERGELEEVVREGFLEETLELPPGGHTGSGEVPGEVSQVREVHLLQPGDHGKLKQNETVEKSRLIPPVWLTVKTLGSSPKDTRVPCRFRAGDGQGSISVLVSSLVP